MCNKALTFTVPHCNEKPLLDRIFIQYYIFNQFYLICFEGMSELVLTNV